MNLQRFAAGDRTQVTAWEHVRFSFVGIVRNTLPDPRGRTHLDEYLLEFDDGVEMRVFDFCLSSPVRKHLGCRPTGTSWQLPLCG